MLFLFNIQSIVAQEVTQDDVNVVDDLSLTGSFENIEFVDNQPLLDSDVDGATYGSDEIYVPEVVVELSDILFDENTYELNTVTTVTNTTDTFLANLEYTLELGKGDELVENGDIFGATEYVYQETHDLGKLAPYEKKEFELTMTVPNNIDPANYVLQIFVNDKNLKFQNGTYTEQPFELSGTGGRLTGLKVYFYADRYGEKTFPAAGLSTEPDDYVMLMLPLDENQSVKDLVDAGEQLRAKVQIFRTVKDGGMVKEFETGFDRKDVNGQNSITVDLLADNEELKTGGSFDVHIAVLNEDGTELYERNMRWLIEFGQIVGRVLSVESGKNMYKKGEAIDLMVTTALFNSEDKKGRFDIVLKGRNGFEQKITKTVTFVGDDVEEVLFSDKKIESDAHLTDVEVSLVDVENNIVVDAYNTDIDFDEMYGREVEKQNVFLVFLQNNRYIIWVVGTIIFGLLAIVIYKTMVGRKMMRMVIIVLLGVNMFFITSYAVEAACDCSRTPSANIWITRAPPSRVTCGTNARMEVALRVSCRSCINGVATRITTSAGTRKDWSYGHYSSATRYYAFTQRISRSTRMWAKAWFIRNGCHCCPRPGGSGCHPGVTNGSMCGINVPIGQVAKTVTCTNPARNGVCGTRHKRTYNYDAVGWGGYSRCSVGTPVPTWPSFPAQGATTTWTCSGSNGGSTANCWAKRSEPPRIDGVCKLQTSPINTLDSKPTQSNSTLCSSGTATTITGDGSVASPWRWDCNGSGPVHTDQTGCIVRMNPGRCGTTSTPYDYKSDWNGTETFCSFGVAVPTQNSSTFPQIDVNNPQPISTSWNCRTVGGDSPTCTAINNPPSISCGVANNETEINTTPSPSSSLCSANAAEINSPALNSIGRWEWNCKYNGLNLTAGPCSAPSCLAGDLLNYSSNVYLKQDPNDQTVSVSVVCDNPNPPKICCDIDAVEVGSNPVNNPTHICTGEGTKEIVVPVAGSYPAQCYFVDPSDPTCEDDGSCPDPVTKTVTISTMCAQKECNAQGSCQSTPIAASDLSQCSSTCNSNADCSSGRIIETRP
jgi:hypothetical protein